MEVLPPLAHPVFRVPILAVFAALLVACGGGGGDGSPPEPHWMETDVKVADVDGDGHADVLAIETRLEYGPAEGRLTLYRQTAPGTFAAPESTPVGVDPWAMAVADINGDRAPDLVITDVEADVIWLLLQDATSRGRFLAPRVLMNDISSYSVVVADLNQDGAPDVAVAASANHGKALTVLYQNAVQRGTFAPPVAISLPGYPRELAAGDVDGDGLADLLMTVSTTVAAVGTDPVVGLEVLFQQPGGGFTDSGVLASQVGLNSDRVAIGDANGDGRPDLLAALKPWRDAFRPMLLALPQTSARAFGAAITTVLDGEYERVLADLNQDGLADTAAGSMWNSGKYTVDEGITLRFNDGSGVFVFSARVETPTAIFAITAGDLNADGRNDIVLYADEQCIVMYQSTAPGVFLPPRALR
jgi:hypothetical protein